MSGGVGFGGGTRDVTYYPTTILLPLGLGPIVYKIQDPKHSRPDLMGIKTKDIKARSLRAPHLDLNPATRRSLLVGILSGVTPNTKIQVDLRERATPSEASNTLLEV